MRGTAAQGRNGAWVLRPKACRKVKDMKMLLICIFCGIATLTMQSPLMGLYVPALQSDSQEILILFAR
jgi:hypothetical protein